jgi:hypothetical protein
VESLHVVSLAAGTVASVLINGAAAGYRLADLTVRRIEIYLKRAHTSMA